MSMETSITHSVGPSVELTPLNEPLSLTFQHRNGKTYEITFLKQSIGNDKENEQEIDLKEYADITKLKTPEEKEQRIKELKAVIEEAKKIIDLMGTLDKCPDDLKRAHSFTFNFTQQYQSGPGLMDHLAGRLRDKWKWKPEPVLLNSITYKETESSEEKTFKVNLDRYDDTARETVQRQAGKINQVVGYIFNVQAQAPKRKLREPEPTPQPRNEEETLPAPLSSRSSISDPNIINTLESSLNRGEVSPKLEGGLPSTAFPINSISPPSSPLTLLQSNHLPAEGDLQQTTLFTTNDNSPQLNYPAPNSVSFNPPNNSLLDTEGSQQQNN